MLGSSAMFWRGAEIVAASRAMSWSSHVDSLLATRKLKHAAIVGLNGAVWAASAGGCACPLRANAWRLVETAAALHCRHK